MKSSKKMRKIFSKSRNKVLNTISNRSDVWKSYANNRNVFNTYQNSKSTRKYANSKQKFTTVRPGSSISTRSGQGYGNVTMFTNVPASRNNKYYFKQLSNKSSKKKVRKSASRLNSSAMSVYTEQPSNLMKSQKENMNNVSLHSYSNMPLLKDQFRTMNNSIMNSRDLKNNNLVDHDIKRVKTTSTNSQIDAQKLLDAMISKGK